MKNTIKLTSTTALVVTPAHKAGLIFMGLERDGLGAESYYLTPDQVGALIFGLEQACADLEIRGQLVRHHDMVEAG